MYPATQLMIEGARPNACGVNSGLYVALCPEPVAYGFELTDPLRPGHGLTCAGHALDLMKHNAVARMWTCSPAMV